MNTSGTVRQIKQKQVKVKQGSKSSKFKEAARLQGFPIRKDSYWTNKGQPNLTHEKLKRFSPWVSKQFSKTVAGGNIATVSKKQPSYGICENIDKITIQK